jgi:hypothetical protein
MQKRPLTEREWRKVKRYCSQYTQAELRDNKDLPNHLGMLLSKGWAAHRAHALAHHLVEEAIKFGKPE